MASEGESGGAGRGFGGGELGGGMGVEFGGEIAAGPMAMGADDAINAEVFQLAAVAGGEDDAATPAFHMIGSGMGGAHCLYDAGARLSGRRGRGAGNDFWLAGEGGAGIISETFSQDGAAVSKAASRANIRLRRAAFGHIRGFGLGLCLLVMPAALAAQATPGASAAAQSPNIIAAIECHGNHRVPCQTIKTRITSKPGAVYDPNEINRDFNSLWNLGYFDDITFSTENTPQGIILHVTVTEKPLVRDIKYEGLKSITESDILDRYKARGVHLER